MQTNEVRQWAKYEAIRRYKEISSEPSEFGPFACGFDAGYDAAASHLQPEAGTDGWISVKDGMPPDDPKKGWTDHGLYHCSETVLAFNGVQTTAEVLTNPKGEASWVAGDESLEGVTHWRELPAAPGSERKGKI